MANEPNITIVGNLTADPELRFTNSGIAVASFTVAQTPRKKNAQGAWEDGDAMFFRCSVWREYAENVAESLKKGARVVVMGRMSVSNYTTQNGEQRQSLEIQVDEIGPSLRYAKAEVTKVTGGANAGGNYNRGGGQGFVNQGGSGQAHNQPTYNAPQGGSAYDAWGQPPAGGSPYDDLPPF
ncbi:single-stranded DNA-binding protein [Actinotignum urinale]|uniref:Single-stranded DNA-binding protein n=1 Tax=Actinotignum urinale TaxID=190146 RepID=A0AAW9HUQ6_9ACTO|nr:single-stranded DNA-binding protein [Actinotignum urinale]MDY5128421.1 single-stranded DNA-binding protein [Actinotignum urinale]MDY5133198.1 single-stranded DNA-binding protein [Actinotignum urinale]MDY5151168.1 single-stranded DNA-binding protein [Actinotignum urinale]MDY5155473.1 single-stranded DNA-binding protein [Actinotignum urinale]MDY5160500.1 single-stranded DNA-binding protein [Actinotignum urinale]